MEEANNNIEILIDMVVNIRKQQDNGRCCDPEGFADGYCPHHCDSCKETYYQIMKNRMMEKYCV